MGAGVCDLAATEQDVTSALNVTINTINHFISANQESTTLTVTANVMRAMCLQLEREMLRFASETGAVDDKATTAIS